MNTKIHMNTCRLFQEFNPDENQKWRERGIFLKDFHGAIQICIITPSIPLRQSMTEGIYDQN